MLDIDATGLPAEEGFVTAVSSEMWIRPGVPGFFTVTRLTDGGILKVYFPTKIFIPMARGFARLNLALAEERERKRRYRSNASINTALLRAQWYWAVKN